MTWVRVADLVRNRNDALRFARDAARVHSELDLDTVIVERLQRLNRRLKWNSSALLIPASRPRLNYSAMCSAIQSVTAIRN